jgi:hypothetical protein
MCETIGEFDPVVIRGNMDDVWVFKGKPVNKGEALATASDLCDAYQESDGQHYRPACANQSGEIVFAD